jgi:hypothetical protein
MKGGHNLANKKRTTKKQEQITSPSPTLSQIQEPQVQSEFLQFYDKFSEFYKTYTNQNQPALVYDFNAFNKATTNRVYDSKGRKYTKEQMRGYLANPEKYEKQIRDCSIYLYNSVHEYKHLIDYMSKMLTHDYVLIPDNINRDLNDKKLINSFYKNLEFIEDYNIKYKLSSILSVLIREDFYFGYERSDGQNYVWQRLPSDYCRPLGWDEFGCVIFEFDFSYFGKQGLHLDNFDPEFRTRYDIYKADSSKRWQQLSDKAICFKLDTSVLYGLPYFAGIFTDLMGIEEYKDDQEDSTRANNFKLIALKIPVYDKEKGINQYLVTLDHIANFVNNAQKVTPEKVGVFAYPGEAEALNLNNNQFDENSVTKAQNDLFTSAGVSRLIGNSEKTSMGLERSINDDEAVMFCLLKQYEVWFKKRLRMFNTDKYKWKLFFPEITRYNREEMFEMFLKAGNAGFSKSPIVSSMGYSQSDFISLADIENNQLNMVESMLKVLPSAATTAGNDEGGNPGKAISNKADASIKGDDLQSNKNRSKTFEEELEDEELEGTE